MQGFPRAAKPRPEQLGRTRRVERDVACTRAAGPRSAGDLARIAALRGGEETRELVPAERVLAGDVENAAGVALRQLEQRRRQLVDADRRPNLVRVEGDTVAECERLLRTGLAVEERRADDESLGMQVAHQPFRRQLRVAVERHRPRLVVLAVAAFALA